MEAQRRREMEGFINTQKDSGNEKRRTRQTKIKKQPKKKGYEVETQAEREREMLNTRSRREGKTEMNIKTHRCDHV